MSEYAHKKSHQEQYALGPQTQVFGHYQRPNPKGGHEQKGEWCRAQSRRLRESKEDPSPPFPTDNPSQSSQRQNQTKTRADMVIHLNDLNHNLLIDFTNVEPTSAYIAERNKACQGVRKRKTEKLKEYRNWNLQSNNGTKKWNYCFWNFLLGIPEDLKWTMLIKRFFQPKYVINTLIKLTKYRILTSFQQFIHERENRSHIMLLI